MEEKRTGVELIIIVTKSAVKISPFSSRVCVFSSQCITGDQPNSDLCPAESESSSQYLSPWKQNESHHMKVSSQHGFKVCIVSKPTMGLLKWSHDWLADGLCMLACDWSENPSVAVRAHSRWAFPLPLWSFGLWVLLLLQHTAQCHSRTYFQSQKYGSDIYRGLSQIWIAWIHTEALLEALSSSLLVGGATPFLERGEEAGAFRRDFGSFDCESSYSSAMANKSLNLQMEKVMSTAAAVMSIFAYLTSFLEHLCTSSYELHHSWPERAAEPGGLESE